MPGSPLRSRSGGRSQGNAGPPQVSLTPTGGGLGKARPWGLPVVPRWASALLVWSVLALPALSAFCPQASAADDIVSVVVPRSDFQAVREALIESIEEEGLVVSAVIPFNDMLQRTAAASGSNSASPFVRAEIVQFCSSRIAWQLLTEDRAQIPLCPLSVSLQQRRDAPGEVRLAWRSVGRSSPGRVAADALQTRVRGHAMAACEPGTLASVGRVG